MTLFSSKKFRIISNFGPDHFNHLDRIFELIQTDEDRIGPVTLTFEPAQISATILKIET